MELFVFELALVYVLINHDKYSMRPLIIDPCPFKLASIRPHHRPFSIPSIEFPISLKLRSFIRHYNIIELLDSHLPSAISFAIFEIASESITTLVLG